MTNRDCAPSRLAFSSMRRSLGVLTAACAVILVGCAVPTDTAPDVGAADSPALQAAALEPPTPSGGMGGEELDALAEGIGGGIDGGEAAAPVAPTEEAGATPGPGLTEAEMEVLTAPLARAEAWLAELEVQWDNGMTYSEIFRAWRSVSAETGPPLAAFEIPSTADASQHQNLEAYYASVQGAHDEWQSTVDFIVTYITNYTPEILITKAYQEVEVHLRDAATSRETLGIAAAVRPEIVIEELVDL